MLDAGRAIGDVIRVLRVVCRMAHQKPRADQCGDYTEGLRRKGKYSWGRASDKSGGDSGGNAAERGSGKDAVGAAGKGIS